MALTVVQAVSSGAANASTPHTTTCSTFTVGNLLVAHVTTTDTSGTTTSTAAVAGTWTKIESRTTFGTTEIWYGVVDTAGQTTVVTNDLGGSNFPAVNVFEISGFNTTTPILTHTNAGTGSTSTLSCPSLSATASGQLYIGGGYIGNGVPTTNSPSTGTVVFGNTLSGASYDVSIYVTSSGAGAIAPTIAANSASGSGTVAVIVDVAAGGSSFTGTAAVTQANNTASASGSLNESGTVAATQANNTASASGTLNESGTAAVTQQNQIANASGLFSIPITGTVAVVQDNNTATAHGLIGGIGITITVLGTPPFYGTYSGYYTLAAAQYAFGPNANPSGLNLTPGTYDVFLVTTQPASGPTKIGTVVILS